jgi:shikimate kinase
VKFYPQLTDIILLSAPAEVLSKRLRTRTNNPYGKRPEELEEVFHYLETVEPILRRGATYEIKTTIPLNQVVEEVLACICLTSKTCE